MYDWCYTADKQNGEHCGEWSVVYGYWDKCLYLDSSKPDYVSLDWKTKHDKIWQDVKADDSFGAFHPVDLFTESVKTTFDCEWDVLPTNRVKAIHGIGAVCPFKVDIESSPFTGLYKPGEVHGLIRMGPGIDFTDPLSSGFLPGAAVKFLRTGRSSANFVLFNELAPLPDNNHNLFAVPLKNHVSDKITDPTTWAASKKFCQTETCITKVGISDVCKYDQDGNEAENLVFPFKTTFVPTGEVNFKEEPSQSIEEFMEQFDQIEAGTNLFTVKGHENPDDDEGVVLGQLILTDKCVSSKYGDTKLFFKHQYIDDDKELRPEWAAAYDFECFCNA